jgi:hypothetical protein
MTAGISPSSFEKSIVQRLLDVRSPKKKKPRAVAGTGRGCRRLKVSRSTLDHAQLRLPWRRE